MDDLNYGNLSVATLKDELRKRGAKVTGRKSELVERLLCYERNKNFGFKEPDEVSKMVVPEHSSYKDLNSSCWIPAINILGVLRYLQVQNKQEIEDSAVQMYHENFMQFIRCAPEGEKCFIHSSVRAEMSKNVEYAVDILIDSDGEILESQCECPVGAWPTAHCKHVMVTFLGLVEFVKDGTMKTEATCTQVLQTFHRPKGQYKGSPIKSDNLPFKKYKMESEESNNVVPSPLRYETRNKHQVQQKGYTEYVNSIVVNYTATHPNKKNLVPFMQLIKPADSYAVDYDHDYLTFSQSEQFLRDRNITQTSINYTRKIETETRSQSESKLWRLERSVRITASVMGSICRATEKRDMAKLAKSIVCPRVFTSKATAHGKKYEEEALVLYALLSEREVNPSGLMIDIEKPYLGASPDGLCDDRVVEIKCPYSAKFKPITPLSVPYLYYNDDHQLSLKSSSHYFYQIMGLMYVTNKPQCDFVVFTLVDMAIINIKKDESFIKEMLEKLDGFFINHLKPCILDHHLYKNFNKYKSFYTL